MLQNILTTAIAAFVVTTPSPSAPPMQLHNWEKLQSTPKTYTVQAGDSLASIAQNVYGNSDYWITLWDDNTWIDNPNQLYSGWQLSLRDQTPTADQNVLSDELKSKQTPKPSIQASPTVAPTEMPESSATHSPTPAPAQSTPQPSPSAFPDTGSSSYDDVYKAAGAKFGVPWQILYGIHMTETGGRNGDIMNHSGSGAEGPMQFMPGTFKAYAQDGDGDGKADIANATDAIYTAANYLAEHGSLAAGLRSYGGNITGTLNYARDRGWDGSL